MKHVPMRTCIQSRKKLPKMDLARFAIDPDSGKFILDEEGKTRSRGANLSLDLDLYDKARMSGAFERALKIRIDDQNYKVVRERFAKYIKKQEFRAGRRKVNLRVKGESINLD